RAATDGGNVYLVIGNVLHALALVDGQQIWKRPLTGYQGEWQVVATKGCLLIYPCEARPDAHAASLFRRALPMDVTALVPTQLACVRGFASLAATLVLEQSTSRFSIYVSDPKDGQLLQQLNFAGQGRFAAVNVFPRGLVVALNGSAWGLD